MNPWSMWFAFGAGILSFASPCTLPLVPSYLGYMTGLSWADVARAEVTFQLRRRALLHTLCFCLGLSLLFLVLGMGATALGGALRPMLNTLRVVGGVLLVGFGLMTAEVVRIPWLLRPWRIAWAGRPASYLGSFLVGLFFAAGWTPCVGPMLASVLALVVIHPAQGWVAMAAYAMGFSLPFLLLALTLASARAWVKYASAATKAGGWLLVAVGLLLATGKLSWLAIWLQNGLHWTFG
ncbi:cytochrome c biogenesis CcdA family protein [Alicyclobacillus contaminans]|uniref:cytochrome c biogenesis CcdA family protein n=1 Tax=Alicyclobacillus contaminans TaxID=392016 RepID=UPI0003FDACF2|nr:cytochrome c biogenesis protein CcdA [Alicyclobacillus contaminans]